VEETLERLAFDLSVRALERQERVVEELRARTGTLSICVCVSILLPNRRLEFPGSGTASFEHFTRLAADVREAHRALAYWHASAWDANQRIVARLTARFEAACVCLILAILFWSLSLALD
jgi:hypothetical protein